MKTNGSSPKLRGPARASTRAAQPAANGATRATLITASLAARRHDAGDRVAMAAAHDACRLAAKKGDPDRFYDANARLHEAIYRASRNGYVEKQTLSLRNRLEPYRRSITFHSGLMERS